MDKVLFLFMARPCSETTTCWFVVSCDEGSSLDQMIVGDLLTAPVELGKSRPMVITGVKTDSSVCLSIWIQHVLSPFPVIWESHRLTTELGFASLRHLFLTPIRVLILSEVTWIGRWRTTEELTLVLNWSIRWCKLSSSHTLPLCVLQTTWLSGWIYYQPSHWGKCLHCTVEIRTSLH